MKEFDCCNAMRFRHKSLIFRLVSVKNDHFLKESIVAYMF